MNVLCGISTGDQPGPEHVHNDNQLGGKVTTQNLQAAKHDGASLHWDRYRVGAPFALCSGMLFSRALFVREGTLRVANKLFGVFVHVHPIRYTQFRSQERRRELGSRLRN